jgi:cytochrome c oxidase assembly factor CtaG
MSLLGGWWTVLFGPPLVLVWVWYGRELAVRTDVVRLRRVCFYAALLLAAVVLVGPLPVLATEHFWAHMVQHILLMMLISPLFVLGSPGLLLTTSRYLSLRRASGWLGRRWMVRQLLQPKVGFGIFLTVLLGTHFSPLANLGMVNSAAHGLELLLFVFGGVIYYYPLMTGNPQPHEVSHAVRVISLFAMMVPETMVGFFLYASSQMLHDTGMTAMGPPNALTDQHIGGALMWSMGMIIDSVWVVLAVIEFFANERKRSETFV